MKRISGLTGNAAAAESLRQIEPDVVAAYPITPSTEVVELFSQYVSDGKVSTEFVAVESEHSAMSACIGASAAGARVATATSSQGLLYMAELLGVASGLRLPLTMALANRSVSAPLNIHGDHSDAMFVRDSGWIQLFCEDAQEVYDTLLQAVLITEDPSVRLPIMVCYDGFTLSHTMERVETIEDAKVKSWVKNALHRTSLLESGRDVTIGSVALPDYFTEHKRQQAEAMAWAESRTIPDVGKQFAKLFGRDYGLIDEHLCSDADVIMVMLGSSAGAAKEAASLLRRHGLRAGVLRVRSFRPFPYKAVREALGSAEAVAVLDRTSALGSAGPLFQEVQTALYGLDFRPQCLSFIGGLGGRDLQVETFRHIFLTTEKAAGQENPFEQGVYFDVRESTAFTKNSIAES